MKAIAILIVMVYLVQPVKVVPVELRKSIDYFNFDPKNRMWYYDSAGVTIYYKDITSFDVMGKWVMQADLAIGSASVSIGI